MTGKHMREKPFYSIRTEENTEGIRLTFQQLSRLFVSLYQCLQFEGYFQEYFGYVCVDAGPIPGKLGEDIEGEIILQVRKSNLWPIGQKIQDYTEDDLFDIIEFLYEYISKPVERQYHSWNECGWHCHTFDGRAGREEFREKANRILREYSDGYELSEDGEILSLPQSGLEPLLQEPFPTHDPQNVDPKIQTAIRKFRRHHASSDDKRDAIRDLADVLEFLRPQLGGILTSKDESDLFNILNNFGLRHHNVSQRVAYHKDVWYDWLFYFYLAAIHGAIRLIAEGDHQP
jgi:hypothetical protein